MLPIVPIFAYLLKDLVRNPKGWVEGFKDRLCHRIEYLPDPSSYDLNRRYKAEDFPEEQQEHESGTKIDVGISSEL